MPEHVADEFLKKDPQAAIATMCEDAYVNHVPTLIGGQGQADLLTFSPNDFIPVMPPDLRSSCRRFPSRSLSLVYDDGFVSRLSLDMHFRRCLLEVA